MAGRSPRRLAIDAGFAAALAALCIAGALADDTPPLPAEVCEAADDTRPRYAALVADGELAITAVFGQMRKDAPLAADDPAWRSIRMFERALVSRGFTLTAGGYRRGPIAVDIVGPLADDAATIDRALDAAIASRDIVYYNGHEYDGALTPTAPATGYRIVVLDSCWSTQRFAAGLLAPTVDTITNTRRAVTGSVASFVAFLDGVDARASWRALLAPMNELAERRARTRTMAPSALRVAEHYRRDVRCQRASSSQ